MFGFLKRRREKRERQAKLQALGASMGQDLRAQLDLFIVLKVTPKRESFLNVFKGQIADIDQRLLEFEADGEVSFEEAARMDFQILLENWDRFHEKDLAEARAFLAEEYEIADAVAVTGEFQAMIDAALAEERNKLVLAAMDELGAALEKRDQQAG